MLRQVAEDLSVPIGLCIVAAPLLLLAANGLRFHLINGFPSLFVGSAFLIFLGSRPTRRDLLIVLGLTAVSLLFQGSWALIFLGTFSALVLGLRSLKKNDVVPIFWAAVFFVSGAACLDLALVLGSAVIHDTWDWNFYRFDVSLGLPGYVLGRLIAKNPTLQGMTWLVYVFLSSAIAMVHAGQLLKGRQNSPKIVPVVTSALIVGYGLYFVMPGVGPLYAFPNTFPWHPPALANLIGPAYFSNTFRNAMPSLHLTLAILLAWHSRELNKTSAFLANAFVLLTIFATLALGEHYLVDLVVAVPFALTIQAGWTKSRTRATDWLVFSASLRSACHDWSRASLESGGGHAVALRIWRRRLRDERGLNRDHAKWLKRAPLLLD